MDDTEKKLLDNGTLTKTVGFYFQSSSSFKHLAVIFLFVNYHLIFICLVYSM